MNLKNLICDIHKNVAIITISRPPVNPLNSDVFRELTQLINELENNEEVKVIVMTGSGEKAFVAGADVKEMATKNLVSLYQMNKKSREAFTKIESANKPIIAAINGLALGGGFELALACDLRISSDKAKFAFPEVGLGIIPGAGGTQRLQKMVGQGIAKELIYFGEMIDARKAQELQLVNKVVAHDQLMDEAIAWAQKLAEKPVVALQMAKTAINSGSNVDIESGLTIETTAFATAFASEDAKEGLSAFTEKRKPEFIGR
ncbi:crotonase [Virgibacillus pantothenticus]|uniref:Enoyl-CoA hydratase n=1 Tax=Virgibacillus pantothenticus TaxID=1473 RepID=A0A0L0QJA7_VIRPA|nr:MULTISPECIES: enoyl-CoA hydratase-related protein [Virgibacillus]API93043.1 enoyl-CoA hydratase [Virgibacillus sp. 6R]KNE18735.1 enoyl-CoA hydratase [Virgibacillus pantothenticus]MBS7429277.1 enoyl-CoA hydratase/isomerase family protein [Virgibacillus sp. 19R1-5]MBU8567083.1 enoyl-CoA hydratase/isomerase family protein [Virgibacillus pantothenticus]MBU8600885.1 enoyl-CoA hydratase/isomerase family protein [Virgibacillus pantothenticus]